MINLNKALAETNKPGKFLYINVDFLAKVWLNFKKYNYEKSSLS